MDKLPYIEPATVEYLATIYPDRAPEPEWTEREVWMARGAVSVVRKLRDLVEQQNENMIGN